MELAEFRGLGSCSRAKVYVPAHNNRTRPLDESVSDRLAPISLSLRLGSPILSAVGRDLGMLKIVKNSDRVNSAI